jgi:hypothetical protein
LTRVSIGKALTARRLRGHAPEGPPAPFIVGMGRSGTTLLRLMLDAHPEMAIPPETHFLPDFVTASRRLRLRPEDLVEALVHDRHRRWEDFGLDEAELLDRFRAIRPLNAPDALRAFYGLYAEGHGKSRWGDKTPGYVKRMRQIHRLLPEVRFVHLIRDGRDVALSFNKRIVDRGLKEPPPVTVWAKRWKRRVKAARADSGRVGEYLEVRYEDLVADTEPNLRRVAEFIELDWDPAILDYHRRAEERLSEMERALPATAGRPQREAGERTRAHAMATRPPSSDRVATWKRRMSESDQREFERVAGELLAELGYETSTSLPS